VTPALIVLALDREEVLGGLAILVPTVALIVAFSQFRLAIRGQIRTAQPVVVVNEASIWSIDRRGVQFHVFLTNHGVSTAFNVRFGVELNGRRFPYTYGEDQAGRGARQVVPPSTRVPENEAEDLPVQLSAEDVWVTAEEGVVARRVLWATYENPFGETWETLNPADPTKDLEIQRVRRPSAFTYRSVIISLERSARWPGRRIVFSIERRP
jgi:hypothetical protein